MRLQRLSPPDWFDADTGLYFVGLNGDDPVDVRVEPREVLGTDITALLDAFDKACARIWGQHWQGSLELVCDLRKGTARKWMKDSQIPPPSIVAWVAFLVTRDDARSQGRVLEGLALSNGKIALSEAISAYDGLRE